MTNNVVVHTDGPDTFSGRSKGTFGATDVRNILPVVTASLTNIYLDFITQTNFSPAQAPSRTPEVRRIPSKFVLDWEQGQENHGEDVDESKYKSDGSHLELEDKVDRSPY